MPFLYWNDVCVVICEKTHTICEKFRKTCLNNYSYINRMISIVIYGEQT